MKRLLLAAILLAGCTQPTIPPAQPVVSNISTGKVAKVVDCLTIELTNGKTLRVAFIEDCSNPNNPWVTGESLVATAHDFGKRVLTDTQIAYVELGPNREGQTLAQVIYDGGKLDYASELVERGLAKRHSPTQSEYSSEEIRASRSNLGVWQRGPW